MSHVILVVDDDPSVRASTLRLLSVRGYAVCEAASAADALVKAAAVRPDAILMDLHMLGTDGVQTAQNFKADQELKHIPIIALSASPPLSDVSALFAAVLRKPCPSEQIVQAIESALAG